MGLVIFCNFFFLDTNRSKSEKSSFKIYFLKLQIAFHIQYHGIVGIFGKKYNFEIFEWFKNFVFITNIFYRLLPTKL